ncbi:ATP-binding protein [Streptomyces hypolithicus]
MTPPLPAVTPTTGSPPAVAASAARITLAFRTRSVPQGRRWLREVLRLWGVDTPTAQTAELLAGEVITNAVVHARPVGVLSVRVGLSAGRLDVSVRDGDPQLPCARPGDRDEAENGRGVLLVDSLSDDWGVRQDAQGKTVWFQLDITPAVTAEMGCGA